MVQASDSFLALSYTTRLNGALGQKKRFQVWLKKRKVDERILGVWLSDKELTTKNWVYPKHVVAEKLSRIENIFGKLQFSFTETVIQTRYEEEFIEECSYRVIASDNNSVVIETLDAEDGGAELVQWFFEGQDVLYVLASGNIEYYRRCLLYTSPSPRDRG